MRISRVEEMATRPITLFRSRGASVTRLAEGDKTSVVRIELRVGGRLGMHRAACSQLFIVVEGGGAVLSEGAEAREVSAGTSTWWRRGDLHQARSETGLVAIVVEAEDLNPATRKPRPTGQRRTA
jgi:quercetin dioxygenase-like cupin family protein